VSAAVPAANAKDRKRCIESTLCSFDGRF